MDPHPVWLDAVEDIVRRMPMKIIAKTSSLAETSLWLADSWPDVVIGETTFRDGLETGRAWVRATSDEFPATKIIVLSASSDQDHINAILASGAAAYVLKSTHADDFAAVIRQVFQRSVYLRRNGPVPLPRQPAPLLQAHALTRREVDVLRLASEGHSNARIARILWVTEQTVKFHLSNIYSKIHVSNRTEASRWAQLNGLLNADRALQSDQVA
jgi:DNA-binding NarL/FixJ family response regulator